MSGADKRSNRSELEQLVERFEVAWQQDEPPVIEDYLPTETARRPAVLIELIHVDLQRRLERDESIGVEQYLARYPGLLEDRAAIVGLIAAEYRLRKQRDPTVSIQGFAERFAEYRDELARELDRPQAARPQRALHVNCPHCRNPIELVTDGTSEDLICPSCGSSFRLNAQQTLSWTPGLLPTLDDRYELLENVGMGAFGAVYRARDKKLACIVAVKVPRSGHLMSPEEEERFEREARSSAQLRHPGIVPVFNVGRSNRFPYIVSELVEGMNLSECLTVQTFSFPESAAIVAQMASALDHAHSRGVVHRDLKPSNIMITPDGAPRLMDFGLAKHDAEKVSISEDGQPLGTPAYMSPEQASGQGHHVDGRSDIYSLGVILYELLTGELPFRGSPRVLMNQVIHREPRPPRSLNDRIALDLDTICLKAMAKEPGRRYATGQEMADDLNHWLKGEPIVARPVSQLERGWRWCRRHPSEAVLSAVAAATLLIGTCSTIFYVVQRNQKAIEAEQNAEVAKENEIRAEQNAILAHENAAREATARREAEDASKLAKEQAEEADRERARANREAAIATHERDRAETMVYANMISRAQEKWRSGDITPARQELEECRPDMRCWEHAYLCANFDRGHETLEGHKNWVQCVAYSPDGNQIASGSYDWTVRVWDAESKKVLLRLERHKGRVRCVAFSPDNKQIASSGYDATILLWDAESGDLIRSIPAHELGVFGLAFSPNGKQIASAGEDETVKSWDVATGREIHTFTGHKGWVRGVAFSPDGTMIASAGKDQTVRLWDAVRGKEIETLKGHTDSVNCVAFSPDGQQLASASSDQTVKLWDVNNPKEVRTFIGHKAGVNGVAYSADGSTITSAGSDRLVKIWDPVTCKERLTFRGNADQIRGVAFRPDGRQIATASDDKMVRIWDTEAGQEAVTLKGHDGGACSVAFTPDGKQLVSAGNDQLVKVWNTETWKEPRTLESHNKGVKAVACSADGRLIASGGFDQSIRIWGFAKDVPDKFLAGHNDAVLSVAFAPAPVGHWVASASGRHEPIVKIWDSNTGVLEHNLAGHTSGVNCVCFNHNGQRIASASSDETVRIWSVDTGAQVEVKQHKSEVNSIAYSNDGRRIATGSLDWNVMVWDAEDAQIPPITLKGHTKAVLSVAFSPDDRRIASGSDDQTIKIWDSLTGQELLTLRAHDQGVNCVTFSRDGRYLASASEDGTVKIWDAGPRK